MNTDIDLVDFMDLLNYTLHKDFVEKWRYKYSEKFIKHFQIKVLESLNKQKILKRSSLFNYMTKKCRYSPDQVENFFISIDISIYSPLIVNDKPRQKWNYPDPTGYSLHGELSGSYPVGPIGLAAFLSSCFTSSSVWIFCLLLRQ